jgi:hypothetical protein
LPLGIHKLRAIFMKLSALFCISIFTAVSTVRAQSWTVVYLTPSTASPSSVNATTGFQQAGSTGAAGHSEIWSDTADSSVDLNPPGASASILYAIAASHQFGSAVFGSSNHAGMWSGTAASFVDLNPTGVTDSFINAAAGSQQAGSVGAGLNSHAAIWFGTAASFIDLNPSGVTSSALLATSGSQQAGIARFNGNSISHAGIWSGTPSSFVDLNPPGASASFITSTTGSQQAGAAVFGANQHAVIWFGAATNFVDLNPLNSPASAINASIGSQQVGYIQIGSSTGNTHAGIWSGTAASFVDLHSFLTADYQASTAKAIWSDRARIFVAGSATNGITGNKEAVLWKFTPALPQAIPTIKITGKKSRTTSERSLVVRGRAGGDVTSVTYEIGKKTRTARGTTSWKFTAKLKPGKNKILISSHGPGGTSSSSKITITRL